nr:PREDICTED: uncharacterized protein LOC105663115 [Megachile rotundata]
MTALRSLLTGSSVEETLGHVFRGRRRIDRSEVSSVSARLNEDRSRQVDHRVARAGQGVSFAFNKPIQSAFRDCKRQGNTVQKELRCSRYTDNSCSTLPTIRYRTIRILRSNVKIIERFK